MPTACPREVSGALLYGLNLPRKARKLRPRASLPSDPEGTAAVTRVVLGREGLAEASDLK